MPPINLEYPPGTLWTLGPEAIPWPCAFCSRWINLNEICYRTTILRGNAPERAHPECLEKRIHTKETTIMNLDPATLKLILDTVFGVIETVEGPRPLLLALTKFLNNAVDANLDAIVAALQKVVPPAA